MPTIQAFAIVNLGISLASVAADIGEIGRAWDGLSDDAKRSQLVSIGDKLGQLEALIRDVRRVVTSPV